MLVVLRLVVGWHFYKQGAEKHSDPAGFSSAGFLSQAKGPLAPLYRSQVPDFHDWNQLLAQPLAEIQLSEEQQEEVDEWTFDYASRVKTAADEKLPMPVEFAPHAPHKAWADKVASDWRDTVGQFTRTHALADEQKKIAADLLDQRLVQLKEYFDGNQKKKFEGQGEAIADYRHQLHRLLILESDITAGDVPFQDQRIAQKRAETQGTGRRWSNDVKGFERNFYLQLVDLVEDDQKPAAQSKLFPNRLQTIDTVITYLILGVGVLLVLGLFTRTAAIAGAAFLLSVVLSQPFWIAGAEDTYYQSIELVSLLVIASTGPGRWAGLDFFVSALCGKCCGPKGT